MTSDVLLSKLDLDKDSSSSDKMWEAKYIQMSASDLQSPSLAKLSDKRSNNSVILSNSDANTNSMDKGKIQRTDTKPGSMNGTWKKKYLVAACHNHASCSTTNNSQASGETSLNCIRFQNFPNRKKLSRKDSLNVNISARKDGQIIIGR